MQKPACTVKHCLSCGWKSDGAVFKTVVHAEDSDPVLSSWCKSHVEPSSLQESDSESVESEKVSLAMSRRVR